MKRLITIAIESTDDGQRCGACRHRRWWTTGWVCTRNGRYEEQPADPWQHDGPPLRCPGCVEGDVTEVKP